MQEIVVLLVGLAVFLLFTGIMMPISKAPEPFKATINLTQFRSRSIGSNPMFDGIVNASLRRALRNDGLNAKYLRQLKQANWFWEPGEPSMPNPKAPFWNLETLWGEKIFGSLVLGFVIGAAVLVAGLVVGLVTPLPLMLSVLGAVVFGGLMGFDRFGAPDSALSSAASKRQRELTLEMGYRIPELRADVMAGNTIQRAIRNMARRPGGPFVEELRRSVAVLDITKDDTLAMDQLVERNEGNELLAEFANNLRMVSRQGGQIGPVLTVLAELAQQRLRLTIQAQARRNLQEMTRPIGVSNLLVTTLLIVAPAVSSVMGSVAGRGY